MVCLLVFSSCNSKAKKEQLDEKMEWNWDIEKAKKQAESFNDSTKWERNTLKMEVEILHKYPRLDLPLFESPFPTPEYSSPGNGNGNIETEIGGKKIAGHYVIIGNGEHSAHLFKNPNDEYFTYFTILTISDGKDLGNPVSATSRNHPHYLSQGSLNTSSESRVDWIAVQLADKNAYAIVNSRFFDLRVGRLILAAPQKDGSIRFYQTDAPPLNNEDREKYLESLKVNDTVINFFSNKNNI